MNDYDKYLEFAKDVASHAGKIMLKYFDNNNEEKYKEDNTIVTLADIEINSFLINEVKKRYPSHAVFGEEEQYSKGVYTWVCDPIDGTAMYARHIPVAVFSLALVIEGNPVVGIIFDPFMNNMYTAVKGKGAFKNNQKIYVSDYKLDDIRTIGHCDMYSKADYDVCDVFKELSKLTSLNDIGSIARVCCSIATGDYSFAIFTGTKNKSCDVAAAKLIIEEAGGIVTDLLGNEQKYDESINGALLSNGVVHDELLEIIRKYLISNKK